MYYKKEVPLMGTRKLITISLPPPLLKKAEELAREENRTKSELLREALRFYVETTEVRRVAARDRFLALVDRVQARANRVPAREIRKVLSEAVEAARRGKRRASA
jgi:predicted transcriptional regulator